MKKYDIAPTKENLVDSIQKDVTGRNKSLANLIRLIDMLDTSWSIAINGSWGSGKTFFTKQCQLILNNLNTKQVQKNTDIIDARSQLFSDEKLHQLQSKPIKTAYYDAWAHDNDEDPIISILNCIASTQWSNEVKDILIKAIDAGINVVNATTSFTLPNLKKYIQSNKKLDVEKIKKQFNQALTNLAPTNGRLIIFIDELDRCKPTYAVKFLERIKHYFNNPKIIFVFSVDLSQLQNTIKRYYGSQFDGIQYLDRFFDLVITLPEPDIEKYFDNTQDILIMDKIFNSGYISKDNWYHAYCKELIRHFNFSIRQINHFYLRANSAAYNLISKNLKTSSWNDTYGEFIMYTFFLPFMIALGESNIVLYQSFINGNADSNTLNIIAENKEFKKYIARLLEDKDKITEESKSIATKIYESVFCEKEFENNMINISQRYYIDNPGRYKSILINACNLLSPDVKLD